jgi:hypothetical protein
VAERFYLGVLTQKQSCRALKELSIDKKGPQIRPNSSEVFKVFSDDSAL